MYWQQRNHAIFMKVITTIIIITFSFNSSVAYAVGNRTLFGTKSHAQRHVKTETETNLLDIRTNPAAIAIPSAYGQIVESYKGKGDRLLVHIQDCHVNELAQLNISRILKILAENYEIKLLSLEGASRRLDTSFYDSFPDGEIKKKISRLFVKEGLFTGAEHYKVINKDKKILAFGAEDRRLYLDHLETYRDGQPDRRDIIAYLKILRIALDKIKNNLYSKELKELETKSRAYKDKITTLAQYALYLYQSAGNSEVDLAPYPNFRSFIPLIQKEEMIDFKKAEEQRQGLIDELTRRFEKKELAKLFKLSLDFRINKISAVAFYGYLEEFLESKTYNLNTQAYKSLLDYIDYLRLSSDIEHFELFDEIEYIEEGISAKLLETKVGKQVFESSRNLTLLEDLYNLRLTHKKLGYIDDHPDSFDIVRISDFIRNISNSPGEGLYLDSKPAGIGPGKIKAALKFYRLATERDIAIVNNTLRRLPYSSNKTSVVITGGFHTSGITNILKEKDISYIVICPIVGTGDHEKLYADRMKGVVPGYESLLKAALAMLGSPLATEQGGPGDIRETFARLFDRLSEPGLVVPTSAVGIETSPVDAVAVVPALDMVAPVREGMPLTIIPSSQRPEPMKALSAGENKKFDFRKFFKVLGLVTIPGIIILTIANSLGTIPSERGLPPQRQQMSPTTAPVPGIPKDVIPKPDTEKVLPAPVPGIPKDAIPKPRPQPTKPQDTPEVPDLPEQILPLPPEPVLAATQPQLDILSLIGKDPNAIVISDELNAEQLKNYKGEYGRGNKIIDIVFGNKISQEQKRRIRLLMLGTVSVETHYLDRNKKVASTGSGRYQITGNTAYNIIHDFIDYPLKGSKKRGFRKELAGLFAKVTNGKVTWSAAKKMSKLQLRKLCASNDDFCALMAILEYKYKGVKLESLPSDHEKLALIWNDRFNTRKGKGTPKSAKERFRLIHRPLVEALGRLHTQKWTEYKALYAEAQKERPNKSWFDFIKEKGLYKEMSALVIRLLQDEYGITASNIKSMLNNPNNPIPVKEMLGTFLFNLGEVRFFVTPKGSYIGIPPRKKGVTSPSFYMLDRPLTESLEGILADALRSGVDTNMKAPSAGIVEDMDRRCSEGIDALFRSEQMRFDTAFVLRNNPFGLIISASTIRSEDIPMLNELISKKSIQDKDKFIILLDADDDEVESLRQGGLSEDAVSVDSFLATFDGVPNSRLQRLSFASNLLLNQSAICAGMILNEETARGFEEEPSLLPDKVFIRAQIPVIDETTGKDIVLLKAMLLDVIIIFHGFGSDSDYILENIIDILILPPITSEEFAELVDSLKGIYEEVLRQA